MSIGTDERGFPLVGAGKPALIIVRGPCIHDSRVLREADTLRRIGYRPLILGVVSEQVSARHSVQQGIPIMRLSPTSPFAWVRSRLQALDRKSPTAGRSDGGGTTGIAIRLHRWIRTLDFYRRAIGVVRELRPALLHCNDYNTMWVGMAARAMGGTTVVYDAHELWPDRNLRPEPRWWLLVCEFLFVRFAHRIITASPGYAEVMARRYRIAPPQVIRNIPDPRPRPEAGLSRPVNLEAGSAPQNNSLALYVGALTSSRGLEISIRALAKVSGARLRLVGPGNAPYRAELAALAQREGVADRVEFADPVASEELLEAMSGATVGLALIEPICLSYEMSLPNKLFEYVTAGVPVLGSDLPAISGFVREHGVGLVARPDDVTDVAAKLSEMLQPRRNSAFRRATREAAAQLRWEHESALLADSYVAAAEAQRGRAG